jgi:O-succinylbenzoate synthase
MKIRHIELSIVEIPYIHPFETSFAREDKNRELIIRMVSGDREGFGECVAMDSPYYSYETVQTAWHIIQDFIIPPLRTEEVTVPEDLGPLFRRIRGHPMAKAGMEEAFWDLYAKEQGLSLSTLLGGTRKKIDSGVSIGIDREAVVLQAIETRLEEGYKRIKIKIKPGWDLSIVKKIRREFGDIPLMVDANAAYTLSDMEIFRKLDAYHLMMIEQPLQYDDLSDHARLQKELETPLCLDESIESARDAQAAIQQKSCRIINIKHGRVGGLVEAKAIHDFCVSHSIPVWAGGMLEFGIGRATNIALASLPGFVFPNDISATDRYYVQDITEPFTLNPDGTITVPRGEGIGVTINHSVLEKYTLKKKSFPLSS